MARGAGVTEACFCVAIEGRPLGGGSSRGPARTGRGSRVLAGERGNKVPAGRGECSRNRAMGRKKNVDVGRRSPNT